MATDTDTGPLLRRVYLTQGVGSTIDGIGLSTAVLFFSGHVGLSAEAIGAVLTVATTVALLLVLPIGVLADAIGLKRAAVGLGTLVAAAFVVYALARNLWLYAVGATLFMVTQAGLGVVRQAIVADSVDAAARVRARAVMQTLINAGMGLGTVVGALAALSAGDVAFEVAFAIAAALAVGCTVLLARMPTRSRGCRRAAPAAGPDRVARSALHHDLRTGRRRAADDADRLRALAAVDHPARSRAELAGADHPGAQHRTRDLRPDALDRPHLQRHARGLVARARRARCCSSAAR